MAGDLNLPNVNWSKRDTEDDQGTGLGIRLGLVENILEEGFVQTINEGTRILKDEKLNLGYLRSF